LFLQRFDLLPPTIMDGQLNRVSPETVVLDQVELASNRLVESNGYSDEGRQVSGQGSRQISEWPCISLTPIVGLNLSGTRPSRLQK
jgi:hypothetical protein